ncbi:hypothetical protein ANCCAN_08464 [Ancylostoma caninum]|uniref:Uncharacterized protein n=1 Tax=Ancylostoma caninum TaxID=29170 RepID=A0A368GMH3_ANCCA|nr:hypothetical protein ANCCAN_08464 [Ancylostoma caninum]
MKELFQICVNTEFVPPLDEDLVTFRFHPIYDQSGCEIPSRFLAEISIKDKVTTLFQLSSGRIYYANGNVVVRTRTFSDARRMLLLRRQAELKEALKDPARRFSRKPRLRSTEESTHTFARPSTLNFFLFSVSGFVLGFFVYDCLPGVSAK